MNTILEKLNIKEDNYGACSGPDGWIKSSSSNKISSINPSTGEIIASVYESTIDDCNTIIKKSMDAYKEWRKVPAPLRGQLVREMAGALRDYKDPLGSLVSLEMGKIKQEGDGEVQEMIDIADFAVGQSRMLYGKTMHSERPQHRMYEQWHPIGPVGVISAFNFPVAVWSWNAFLSAICGNTTIWKPSEETPLCAIAVQNICNEVLKINDVPDIFSLVIGNGSTVGENLINNKSVPLVSFTGSTKVGKHVGEVVSSRFGKTILELGGNNCIIVDDSADMNMVVPAIVFGAVGTAGQRCTSTRRIIVHENIYDDLIDKVMSAYKQVKIGDPLNKDTLMGPVVNEQAVSDHFTAIEKAVSNGGKVLCGGSRFSENGSFVEPTIIEAKNEWSIVQKETFTPILYIMKYDDLEDAIRMHNDVPQGLSSSMFTLNIKNAETFLSAIGSDCGIANINIGTSGAEIGGAFGGEKETGGGRESGSDSWKQYMRRQTNTINWGSDLPLAQGIEFNLGD
ncbi:MAG: aldehyde dehydrogenase family protein [Candidatus Marinimicrobia bacterium]|nr:aldehyde dehydrogenase family protein [Candidatus Neomarinimicrobiota bacterium]